MLRSLYDRTIALAAHPHALWVLAALSFLESSFFPIPVEAMMLPMMFARPKRSFWIAFVASVASVLGGIAGYAIGLLLFDTVGQPILAFYGYEDKFAAFQEIYGEWGWWIVIAGGFTPLPYKVITITSGVMALNPWVFIIASFVSRALRFAIEAALIYFYGEQVRAFVERRLALVTTLGFVLLLAGFIVIRYVV